MLVIGAGSVGGTIRVTRRAAGVEVLGGDPPITRGRNLGGKRADGNFLVFLDADGRLPEGFLETLFGEMERSRLDVAGPTLTSARHRRCAPSLVIQRPAKGLRGLAAAGGGELHRGSGRRLPGEPGLRPLPRVRRYRDDPRARERRFGIGGGEVYVSDRRFREDGASNTCLRYLLMSMFFALGRFEWANRVGYEFGKHGR